MIANQIQDRRFILFIRGVGIIHVLDEDNVQTVSRGRCNAGLVLLERFGRYIRSNASGTFVRLRLSGEIQFKPVYSGHQDSARAAGRISRNIIHLAHNGTIDLSTCDIQTEQDRTIR